MPLDRHTAKELLRKMEGIRERYSRLHHRGFSDHVIRLCEAEVAEAAGYPDRATWVGEIRRQGER